MSWISFIDLFFMKSHHTRFVVNASYWMIIKKKFCRECIECTLFNTGKYADNHTCQRMCKDEITVMDTLGEYIYTQSK